MGKSIPVKLGCEIFDKKEDVKNRIQTMVKNYPVMHFVTGSDIQFCLCLFSHHPNYLEKLGVGIANIQIRLDKYGNRYFHLLRVDGSDDDISWKKCLAAIK